MGNFPQQTVSLLEGKPSRFIINRWFIGIPLLDYEILPIYERQFFIPQLINQQWWIAATAHLGMNHYFHKQIHDNWNNQAIFHRYVSLLFPIYRKNKKCSKTTNQQMNLTMENHPFQQLCDSLPEAIYTYNTIHNPLNHYFQFHSTPLNHH